MTNTSAQPEVTFPEVIDSTMLADAKKCLQLFQYQRIRGFDSPSPSIHLHAGAVFAHGLETARKLFYGAGWTEPDAIEAAQIEMITAWGDYSPMFSWDPGAEWESKWLDRLVQALDFYFSVWPMPRDLVQPLMGENGPTVEFKFAVPLDIMHPETGNPILYAGRFDMFGEYGDGTWVVDEKTTKQLGPTWAAQWDLRSQFTGYCLTGDTEVLTPHGWVRLDTLPSTEKVAQWSEGSLTFVRPLAHHSPHFEGELITADGKVSMWATPDHRQPLYNVWRGENETRYVKGIPQGSGNLRFHSAGVLQQESWIPDAFIQLLVAAQADGSFRRNFWRFSFKKPRKIERLSAILEELETDYTRKVYSDGRTVFALKASNEYGQLLNTLLGPEKEFGSWLLDLGTDNLSAFINEVQYWDGSSRGTRGWMYFTTNRVNMEWVRTIAAVTGHYSSVHSQVEGNWRVNITKNALHSVHLHTWGTVKWDGPVYCLTVPSGYFLARRDGKTFVTGNCWAARQYGIQPIGAIVRGISFLKSGFGSAEAIKPRPQHMIDDWEFNTKRLIRRLIAHWHEGIWDRNLDDSCNAYGGCPFKHVCKSPDPEPWLASDFVVRHWNPLAER